jgi:glycosyltransferase involved in cell wall biosynthesis
VKPVLFLTGHAPAYRVGAFARLHALEEVEFAFFGGAARHGGAPFEGELPFPHRHVSPREIASLAAGGRYRAVVCPTGGRLAPLAGWTGARRARVPLIVWASLWAHPRSLAHALTYLPLRRLYRSADAVVTYGPHVSAYVRARGARNVYVAPQSVDNDFWGAPETQEPSASGWPGPAGVRFLFAGRAAREKGLQTLLAAWRATGLRPPAASLVLAGAGSLPPPVPADAGGQMDGVSSLDPLAPLELRRLYASAGALIVPSIATRTFREPWGLVVNEAFCQALPVIASDEVGATAGGLVRDEHNGLVVAAGDSRALARAVARLAGDRPLRQRLGAAAAEDVRAYSHDAWARGFSEALASLGLSLGHRGRENG